LLFSIVDLHAITVQQDASELARWRKEMLASLYAIGLKKERSIVFYQSAVPQHAELMWLLSCTASMGYLSRMTQWKVRFFSSLLIALVPNFVHHVDDMHQSKLSLPSDASPLDPSPTNKTALKLGLFSYPVLQAADILLYNTTHVPVGEDQAQHLEFARELAAGFNHVYAPNSKEPILIPPQTILSPAKRVMSLTNPAKKMSKSDPDPKSRILITDSFEDISRKFRTALTDSIEGVSYDHATRPGVSNLVDIIYHMDESKFPSPEAAAQDMNALSMKALKEQAAKTVETGLRDVRERYEFIMGRKNADKILEVYSRNAKNQAGDIAWGNMNRIKGLMGLGQNV
jgi:tryptophanyl-tRNA synthetase